MTLIEIIRSMMNMFSSFTYRCERIEDLAETDLA